MNLGSEGICAYLYKENYESVELQFLILQTRKLYFECIYTMDLRQNYSHEFRPSFARGDRIRVLDASIREKRIDLEDATMLEKGHNSAVSRIMSDINKIGSELAGEKDLDRISSLVNDLENKKKELFISSSESNHEKQRREKLESEVKNLEEERKRMADMKGGRKRRVTRSRKPKRRHSKRRAK